MRHLWQRYWENCIEVSSLAPEALGNAAREAEVMLAIGITARDGEFIHGMHLHISRDMVYCVQITLLCS